MSKEEQKIDWARIMAELKAAGCSRYRVALTLGVADASAKNWCAGGEPRYGLGAALLKLYAEKCNGATPPTKTVSEIPVTS